MATILIVTNGNGTTRRCDARCHDAKGQKCGCVCGGIMHGVTPSKLSNFTLGYVLDIVKDKNPRSEVTLKPYQTSLF